MNPADGEVVHTCFHWEIMSFDLASASEVPLYGETDFTSEKKECYKFNSHIDGEASAIWMNQNIGLKGSSQYPIKNFLVDMRMYHLHKDMQMSLYRKEMFGKNRSLRFEILDILEKVLNLYSNNFEAMSPSKVMIRGEYERI